MPGERDEAWWRKTRMRAIVALAVPAAAGLLLAFFSGPLGRETALGLPLDVALGAILLPLVTAAAVFRFASRQAEADRRQSAGGD